MTEHFGNSVFVKGCKTLYANQERKSAPASNAIVRLCTYEDTGLSPEEIKALIKPLNKPLTLDDLREMNGMPVWCVDGDGNQCWGLVNCEDGVVCCYDNESGLWNEDLYEVKGDGNFGLHQMGWRAYRSNLEDGTT